MFNEETIKKDLQWAKANVLFGPAVVFMVCLSLTSLSVGVIGGAIMVLALLTNAGLSVALFGFLGLLSQVILWRYTNILNPFTVTAKAFGRIE